MHCNIKIACFAVACLAVTSHADASRNTEEIGATEQQIYARNALEKDAAAIKAEFGEDVDTSLDGYDHLLLTREAGEVEDDAEFAAQLAASLAEDDEEYDAVPDGVSEEEYQKELDEKDAADDTIPVERRDADAKLVLPKLVFSPSAAERKRLGRMKPHYVKHTERVSADLKQFMRRFADDPDGDDEEVDVSLEGYDHELVKREFADIDDGENDWEEPQEELKGYDHSKLEEGGELSPEDEAKYLKRWNPVVARDFEELEDDNDRYEAPEEEAETIEKRGYTRLQKLRIGVKALLGHEG
ncbi:uncharacterized protein RCC_06916 [Ramularia collo-cygni]|uniref:Uncharacterized protein n=1 Tax=Ramularia collo-cygni TaxID=112498 RepID=A0A2D3V2X3_9PEZI|nr:uncharacterized protein RCC_06916 [Ramularia collo-cygni]CZT21055.1 uncharacterized protein RCC_06916 [Ramularia collo-cygni]